MIRFLQVMIVFFAFLQCLGCSDKADNSPIDAKKPTAEKTAPPPGEEPVLPEEGP